MMAPRGKRGVFGEAANASAAAAVPAPRIVKASLRFNDSVMAIEAIIVTLDRVRQSDPFASTASPASNSQAPPIEAHRTSRVSARPATGTRDGGSRVIAPATLADGRRPADEFRHSAVARHGTFHHTNRRSS